MTRRIAFALTALVLTLATGVTAALAGTGRSSADPGVTPTSILLGTTSPLSGAASAYASVARGADAYFKYVNARGGVNGRKIDSASARGAVLYISTLTPMRRISSATSALP